MNFSSSQHPKTVSGTELNGKKTLVLVLVAVASIVLILGGLGLWKLLAGDSGVKKDQYQAVFLTNDQVYFGKLARINSKYIEMTDIYYLQVQQDVQPAKDSEDQPQVSLAKLGDELHGPEDKMTINREQVLFWENLKNDSKVVQAINQNKQ